MHAIVVILLAIVSIVGDKFRKNKFLFYGCQLILVLYFTYIASFYGAYATDHDGYVRDYYWVEGDSFSTLFDNGLLGLLGKTVLYMEPGYYALNLLCHILGLGELGLFFFVAFVVNTFIIKYVYNNENSSLSLLLLLSVNIQLVQSNLVRQILAMAFLLPTIKYLCAKDYLKYIVGVVFASMFHMSAVIFIIFTPVCFIKESHLPQIKKYSKVAWIGSTILATGVLPIGFDSVLALFGGVYDQYAGNENNVGTSTSISIILLYNLITYFALKYDFTKNYTNVILMVFCTMVINLSVQSPNFARLYYYFIVIGFCYMAYLVSNKVIFPKSDKKWQAFLNKALIAICVLRIFFIHILSDPTEGMVPYAWTSFFKM